MINRTGIPNLELLTCTDVKQAWGKLKASPMYQARELQELCHVQPQPRLHFSAEEQQAIRERLIKALPQSALALHFHGRMQQATGPPPPALVPTTKEHALLAHMLEQDMDPYTQMLFHDAAFQDALKLKIYIFSAQDLSEAEQSFYSKHVAVSEAQAVTMLAETRSQENTKWHRERKVRITGSKCHEYFTFVPKENRSWEEKISAMMADTFRGNDATRYGKESEPEATATYENLMANEVTQVGFLRTSFTAVAWIQPRWCHLQGGQAGYSP
ncbi:hypothetical protein HPB48_013203 [Haemaphysalis longicornis]|uniref:YqaJ viral recombinase domain-containing protein n=1 Tax=Haemaphysalis longicornis TaxID=44386 RepID=A0A9J6GV28_HAELO|nr:hypothetical protein HPB48_013203 [Haemaphysalis longicornis]